MSDRVAAQTQQTAASGASSKMHAHEMNVDPDLDGKNRSASRTTTSTMRPL
jgi:hypothetical protein